jgi:hypothetical protein
VLPGFFPGKLLAYGNIEVKPRYCALATTGFELSAIITGNPVLGLIATTTGACVEEPNIGEGFLAMAGPFSASRERINRARVIM